MKRTLSWIIVIVAALAVVFGLRMVVSKAGKHLASAPVWSPRPVPVEVAPVVEETLMRTIRYLARLEAVATAEIAPRISARITAIEVDEGDTVTAGALLAQLDDREIQAQIAALAARIKAQKARLSGAQAGLGTARMNMAYLEREYERAKRVYENKGISTSALEAYGNRLDDAKGKLDLSEQEVRSIEQEIAALGAQMVEARTRLSDTEIRADYPGTIRNRLAEVGDMARPGVPMFNMMNISSYRLKFDMVQKDLAWIRPGQHVRVDWPGRIAKKYGSAVVSRIFPSLESDQTIRAEIDLSCRCPDPIKIGSLVPIRVVVSKKHGLVVPRSALIPTGEGGSSVYVIRNGKLKRITVAIDFTQDRKALIRGDLNPGETVAVGEYLQWVRLYEGQEVSL